MGWKVSDEEGWVGRGKDKVRAGGREGGKRRGGRNIGYIGDHTHFRPLIPFTPLLRSSLLCILVVHAIVLPVVRKGES